MDLAGHLLRHVSTALPGRPALLVLSGITRAADRARRWWYRGNPPLDPLGFP